MKTLKSVDSIRLNLTADELWNVLTLPEWTQKYMYNCEVISDFKVGSKIDWKGEYEGQKAYLTGEILDVVPMERLKYSTIDPSFSDASIPENFIHVTYELKPQNGEILLTIVNETFDGSEERMSHIIGGMKAIVFPGLEKISKDKTKEN